MKKINAMYKTEKYHQTKPGSIHDVVAQMQMNEQKSVSIKVNEFAKMVETYLLKGGVIDTSAVDKEIAESTEEGLPLHQELPLNEVREFITTYNKWFSTNHRAEEFVLDEGITLGGKPVVTGMQRPRTGPVDMPAKKVKLPKDGGNPAGSKSVTMPEKVDAAGAMGAEPKEPNAFQKFVGKVKKVGSLAKDAMKTYMYKDLNKDTKKTLGLRPTPNAVDVAKDMGSIIKKGINKVTDRPNIYKGKGAFDTKMNTGIRKK